MPIVDDPMLALIVRFVSRDEQPDVSDEVFLQRQVAKISDYVEQFPQEEKTKRALEWIGAHARKYRQEWQCSVATQQFSRQRCVDCPLIANESLSQCEIHNQWLALLQRYADNSITSTKYVEKALRMLEEHKARLQVTLTTEPGGAGQKNESRETMAAGRQKNG